MSDFLRDNYQAENADRFWEVNGGDPADAAS